MLDEAEVNCLGGAVIYLESTTLYLGKVNKSHYLRREINSK